MYKINQLTRKCVRECARASFLGKSAFVIKRILCVSKEETAAYVYMQCVREVKARGGRCTVHRSLEPRLSRYKLLVTGGKSDSGVNPSQWIAKVRGERLRLVARAPHFSKRVCIRLLRRRMVEFTFF